MHSVALPLALLLALTSSLHAGNLFKDPGFEQKSSRWSFYVPGSSKAHGNTFAFAPGEGVGGSAAAKITLPVMSRCGVAQQNIPVTGWKRYRISYWFKADKGVEYIRGPLVRLNFRSPGAEGGDTDIYVGLGGHTGSEATEVKRPDSLPTEWEKVEVVVEAPMNANAVSIGFFGWGMKGSIYFDDVSLVAVDAPAP